MTESRRALPAIPLTPTSNEQQQQQGATTSQRQSSTSFNDDGHYSDIHLTVAGGRAARIPTWRRSIVDDPDHYSYLDVNLVTGTGRTVEQPQRSSGYQGLNPAELALLRRPRAPDPYTGMRSNQPQSRTDPEVSGNHGMVEELRQPSGSIVHTTEPHQGEGSRQGYERFDPSVVEQLRRPQRPHSYAGINASSVAGRHSYLEIIGYAGTDNLDVPRRSTRSYEGLDPAAVEELRRPQRPHSYAGIDVRPATGRHSYLEIIGYARNDNFVVPRKAARSYQGLGSSVPGELRRPQRPHSWAGIVNCSHTDRSGRHSYLELTGCAGTNNTDVPKTAAGNYEGLDPAEVAELRRRANIPQLYAGLTGGVNRERQGEVTESKGYEGLNPDEVEAIRQRTRQPTEYAGLRDNVEDLYSRPIKKHKQ